MGRKPMTEAEWHECEDALTMLRFLCGRLGQRKLRLLACACARSRWAGLIEEEYRRAVVTAERFADGLAGLRDLRTAWDETWGLGWGEVRGEADANGAAAATIEDFAADAAERAIGCVPRSAPALVREILGNPFAGVTINPDFPATVSERFTAMAHRIYDEHRFEDLPFLSELLSQSGYRDEALITHLRSPGPHFRGCWALDAILGKGQGRDLVSKEDWQSETHPFYMLNWWRYYKGEPSPRKSRLLACACCRLVWHLFIDEHLRLAVETAEAFADGLASPEELAAVHEQAHALGLSRGEVLGRMSRDMPGWAALADSWRVAHAAADVSGPDDTLFGNAMHYVARDGGSGRDTDDLGQANLIRELLGTPLRQGSFDSTWSRWADGAVFKIAQASYDLRDFSNLPILADALEEAGCTDVEILSHLRGPGPHVRGCWALDLILGKN